MKLGRVKNRTEEKEEGGEPCAPLFPMEIVKIGDGDQENVRNQSKLKHVVREHGEVLAVKNNSRKKWTWRGAMRIRAGTRDREVMSVAVSSLFFDLLGNSAGTFHMCRMPCRSMADALETGTSSKPSLMSPSAQSAVNWFEVILCHSARVVNHPHSRTTAVAKISLSTWTSPPLGCNSANRDCTSSASMRFFFSNCLISLVLHLGDQAGVHFGPSKRVSARQHRFGSTLTQRWSRR
ncbi:hypothetical protein KCV07_g23, partial [Aureobasidium melanogenum]